MVFHSVVVLGEMEVLLVGKTHDLDHNQVFQFVEPGLAELEPLLAHHGHQLQDEQLC